MEFLLILSEDADLVATDEDRQQLVARTGEYAMGLVGQGRMRGGGRLEAAERPRTIRARGGETRVLDGPFSRARR